MSETIKVIKVRPMSSGYPLVLPYLDFLKWFGEEMPQCETGDRYEILFDEMLTEDFEKLEEHTGF